MSPGQSLSLFFVLLFPPALPALALATPSLALDLPAFLAKRAERGGDGADDGATTFHKPAAWGQPYESAPLVAKYKEQMPLSVACDHCYTPANGTSCVSMAEAPVQCPGCTPKPNSFHCPEALGCVGTICQGSGVPVQRRRRRTFFTQFAAAVPRDPPRLRLPHNFSIFVHELPPELNSDLVRCYDESVGWPIWEDESKERAQNTADIWLHQILEAHPLRTQNASKASVFFVPFYGFLSTNFSGRNGFPKCGGLGHLERVNGLADWLQAEPLFQQYPEKHVLVASYWAVAHKEAPRWKNEMYSVVTGNLYDLLGHSHLLVYEPHFQSFNIADEYKNWTSNVTTIPYIATQALTEAHFVTPSKRPYSLFFRGNLRLDSSKHKHISQGQQLRSDVVGLAARVVDARIEDSSGDFEVDAYTDGMLSATFCLVLRGDTPTSRRLFDAIAAGCIPVIVSDELSLPFDEFLDWSKFSIRVRENDVRAKDNVVAETIAAISEKEVNEMQMSLLGVREDFVYGYGDPLSISQANIGRAADNILLSVSRHLTRTKVAALSTMMT